MCKLLKQVAVHGVGKHLIAATLENWERQPLMRSMTEEQQDAVVAEFGRRIEQRAHDRKTAKLLKKAGAVRMLFSADEQKALQNMKWAQASAAAATAAVPCPPSSSVSAAPTVAAPHPSIESASILFHAFQQQSVAMTMQWNQIDLPPHLFSPLPGAVRPDPRIHPSSGPLAEAGRCRGRAECHIWLFYVTAEKKVRLQAEASPTV